MDRFLPYLPRTRPARDALCDKIMADKPSDSQLRLLLAQFLFAHDVDIETLYNALGADLSSADSEAVSHMAGIIDGVTLATSKIRAHGLDNWAKS